MPPQLPAQLTSFVGRQQELAHARRLLAGTRLLTLTGPGGSGKTRLAIQLATAVAADFPDGVFFVPLAPIRDATLVLPSIAQAIGLHDARDGPLVDHLASHLREKATLLILDNFEQLLAAAPFVADLLRHTLALTLMITSRACLRIGGEQEFNVPPLRLPQSGGPPAAATVAAAESVKLFVERARATLPGFTVDETNAACVAQIAGRLDGLPLAIELAAARVKLLPPQLMLPRLEHSLSVLVSGPRDLPDRQQTLRATIAWSYGLLSASAQRLLAGCSVFRGATSLERIEAVCVASGLSRQPVLMTDLEELLDHNLLRRIETRAGPRLTLLETIREYAAERLAELPEEHRSRECHAAEFLALAEEGERQLSGPGEKHWLDELEVEHNNLRTAMDLYAREAPERALRMAIALRRFWSARGHFTEGRQRLHALLDQLPARTPTRVRALNCAAWLAVDQGDYADASSRLDESITLSRALGDRLGEGLSLAHLGRCKIAGGQPHDGVSYLDAAMPILRATATPPDVAIGLLYWGLVAIFTDHPAVACERLAEGVGLCRQLGFRSLGARALYLMATAHIELGDLGAARAALEESLPTSLELGDAWVLAQQLGAFAALAAKTGRPGLALRLAGFQAAYSRAHEFAVPTIIRNKLDSWIAPARQALGARAADLFAEGERLTLENVVASTLEKPAGVAARPTPRQTLTPREREVARLVATGRTNREIAQELGLSVRTVEVHVDHILTKFDFTTRTQLAAWMHQHDDALALAPPKNT